MRRKYLSLLLLPLAACATPQEQCVAAATQDLRVLDALILETRTNIERGFGVEEVIVPNSGFTWCYGNWGYNTGINFCSAPSTRTVERPVTIDLEVERRKLRELERSRSEAVGRTQRALAACEAQFGAT
jgi:hypothetical protein